MGGAGARVLSLGLLLAAGWVAIGIELAPMGRWPAPDLLFCVVALWALRRPGWTPAAAAFGLGLARDLLTGGPPGLGALGLLAASEALRARAPGLRRRGLAVEWAAAGVACAGALALQLALLTLTLAATPPLGDLGLRLAATAAAWPVVALTLRWAVRIGPAPLAAEGGLMFERRGA